MRQYSGYGTAEETNQRFKYLLDQGQTGLSVAFDLPTQIAYDSDHPLAEGEVGRVGVAMYIVTAEEQGVDPKNLTGTIQNDILKEYIARGTYVYQPEESLKLITDIFEYCIERNTG